MNNFHILSIVLALLAFLLLLAILLLCWCCPGQDLFGVGAGVVQVNNSIKIGCSLSCYLLYVGCLCYKGKRTIKEEKARNKVSPASEEDIQVSKIIITRKEE